MKNCFQTITARLRQQTFSFFFVEVHRAGIFFFSPPCCDLHSFSETHCQPGSRKLPQYLPIIGGGSRDEAQALRPGLSLLFEVIFAQRWLRTTRRNSFSRCVGKHFTPAGGENTEDEGGSSTQNKRNPRRVAQIARWFGPTSR